MYNGTDVISDVVEYDVYRLVSGYEELDCMGFLSEEDADKYIQKRAKEIPYYAGCVYKTIDGVLQNAEHMDKD